MVVSMPELVAICNKIIRPNMIYKGKSGNYGEKKKKGEEI